MNIHNPVDRSQCTTHCNSTITDIPQVEKERILPRTRSTPSQTGSIEVKGYGASRYIVRFVENYQFVVLKHSHIIGYLYIKLSEYLFGQL